MTEHPDDSEFVDDRDHTNSTTDDAVEPRERCPYCSDLLEHESRDPLEEFCISSTCEYYRAEMGDGRVRERNGNGVVISD